MKTLLRVKFDHPPLRKKLLETNSDILHEHTNRDTYWGDGLTGICRDFLGKMIMNIRRSFIIVDSINSKIRRLKTSNTVTVGSINN